MAAWALQKAAYAVIGLDSVWLLSDTRGVKEKPTVGSEVIIRIGHNLLPARVLAIRDTGTYQVRLEHVGSILWTRSIIEELHKRARGGGVTGGYPKKGRAYLEVT